MTVGREASKLMKELIAKSAVTEKMILFCNDRVKDGQKFVTTDVLFNMMTLMLNMPNPSAHSLTNLIKTQVGKE